MTTSTHQARAGWLAPLGGAIFTLTWLVLGFVSDGYQMWDITVTSYSPVAQPISGLGLGSTAPIMNTAFVLCGILISLGTWTAMRSWPGAGGRSARWSRRAVLMSGVGMAVCGLFDLESILLHTLGFLVGVGLPGLGFSIAGRALRSTPHRRLSTWLRLAGPLTLVGMVAYLATFDAVEAGQNTGVAGLTERVVVTVLMITVGAIGLSGTAAGTVAATSSEESAVAAGGGRP